MSHGCLRQSVGMQESDASQRMNVDCIASAAVSQYRQYRLYWVRADGGGGGGGESADVRVWYDSP